MRAPTAFRAPRAGLLRATAMAAALFAALALAGCSSAQPTAPERTQRPRTYHLSFDLACVDGIDYMSANRLSNYLHGYTEGTPVDPAMQAVINSTTFGGSVSLLTSGGTGFGADYAFSPESAGREESGGITTFRFDAGALRLRAGVPYVEVEAGITPVTTSPWRGDGSSLDGSLEEKCVAATSFWPRDDASIARTAAGALGGATSLMGKVEALWKWVRSNIRYGGPQGTRWGTLKVLDQGFGRCWDLSDVFVTLCRAAGIPSRQVAGWLVRDSGGGGHVWAQVYASGKGWISVDCTSDRLGSDSTYVAYFATYDGAMPILYVEFPDIR